MDVAEVFAGRRSARWALGFVGQVMIHPHSRTRALLLGGEHWRDWIGWSKTAERVVQNTNVTIAAAGGTTLMEGPRATDVVPPSMDAAYARLMS